MRIGPCNWTVELAAEFDGRDSPAEDALLEVMDLLTGFCDTDLVLLPE